MPFRKSIVDWVDIVIRISANCSQAFCERSISEILANGAVNAMFVVRVPFAPAPNQLVPLECQFVS